jgi:molybdate transport system ATP-binding protein
LVEGLVSGVGLEAEIHVRRDETFRIDLQISIPPGRTVALLGPNGAGKSTAVAALAGLLALDEGDIQLDGVVLDAPHAGVFVVPEKRGLGVVFQDFMLFPHMTVVDNVAFGLRSRGVGREAARARASSWIERVGLAGFEGHRPARLSGGQAQRAALARALVTEPAMLLLDEPLSALDVTTRARLRRSLADHLDAFAGPRLLITHDPIEAFLLADEILIIEEGKITQIGSADEIRLRPRTAYAADLGGSNLFTGTASTGGVTVGSHILRVADTDLSGEVLVNISPSAVSIHRSRPEGSPRNAWETRVERIEGLGDRARLATGGPLRLTAEVTRAALDELSLATGDLVWISIKATEIGVEVAGPGLSLP